MNRKSPPRDSNSKRPAVNYTMGPGLYF